MSITAQAVATHVEIRPNRAGHLRAFIAGTRVRVQDIYAYSEVHGHSPEQIAQDLPHLTLGQVHAALSYYFDHRAEILREIEEDRTFSDAMKAANGPSLLERHLPNTSGA